MKTISANMNVMIMACEKASKSLIRDFGEIEKLQVSVKGPSDFVSSADKKVEKTLISELKKSRPNYSILSEEIGEIKSENSEYRWIIDPIDGTLNFLHGIPHFAISLALEKKNEIICGVIYDPIKNEMFLAEKEKGAYVNNQRIRVSSRKKLKDCMIFTGGPTFKTDKKATGINWKATNMQDSEIEKGKVATKEVSQDLPNISTPQTPESGPQVTEISGDKIKFIPEKIRAASTERLIGNGFNPNETLQLFLNDTLLESIKADQNGNFITAINIPSASKIGMNDFQIKRQDGIYENIEIKICDIYT